MSPRSLPLPLVAPSPRRRWIAPCLVPGATLIFFVPLSVGTSIVPPCTASGIEIGTVTSRLPSSSRRKTGDAATRVGVEGAPVRPAGGPRLAFAGEPDAGAVLHPGRDVRPDPFVLLGEARAAAGGAGVLDDLAGAGALRGGLAGREEALVLRIDPAAFSARAVDRRGAGRGARAVAGLAAFGLRHG